MSLLPPGPGPVGSLTETFRSRVVNSFAFLEMFEENSRVADRLRRHSELNQSVSLGINSSASPVPGPPPSGGTHGTNQERLNDSVDGEQARRRLQAKGLFLQPILRIYLSAPKRSRGRRLCGARRTMTVSQW